MRQKGSWIHMQYYMSAYSGGWAVLVAGEQGVGGGFVKIVRLDGRGAMASSIGVDLSAFLEKCCPCPSHVAIPRKHSDENTAIVRHAQPTHHESYKQRD